MNKTMLDVHAEVLGRELSSQAPSAKQKKSTPQVKESDSHKSSDASDVKQKASEGHDESLAKTKDEVSSYNRYKESQRKYEKGLEEIQQLKSELKAASEASAKKDTPEPEITDEKFQQMYEEDQSKAFLAIMKQFSNKTKQEVAEMITKEKAISTANQAQYVAAVKAFPELSNLNNSFAQEVDAEIKDMQAKGINYPEMITHAAQIVYGKQAKAGTLSSQKAEVSDEKKRLERISQGQTVGKSFSPEKDDSGLTESQIANAKAFKIDVNDPKYQAFIKRDATLYKKGKTNE